MVIKFIVPYYGKFPTNFKEWVYTASMLKEQNIKFLFFTDLIFPCKIPENFEVVKMSFEDIRQLFQNNFDFDIKLNSPYKFCDFRPCFGEVFSRYLSDVDFWGHCDVDMVWGDVKEFITDDVLNKYEKIQYMGHFGLYKNIDSINRLYKSRGGLDSYKKVFSSDNFYSFDEHPGIMSIITKNPVNTYISTNQADFSPAHKRLYVSRRKNYKYQIFYWIDGHVYRYFINDDNKIGKDEFMYAHFQRKRISDDSMPDSIWTGFLISTTGFKPVSEKEIDYEFIKQESDFVSEECDLLEVKQYRKNKIREFLKCSIQDKVIWIKIKLYTRKTNKYFKHMIFS